MRFADVIGQEDVKMRLLNMIMEGRMPHAIMLTGPRGSGKMALALALASYLLCSEESKTEDSCGHCRHCRLTSKLQHPDLHFTFPTIKLPSMGSDHKPVSADFMKEWQEMLGNGPYFTMDQWLSQMGASNQQAIITAGESDELTRKLSLKSFMGSYKIVVMWLPERMNEECANKILKLIEEPPQQTIFIMASEQPELLPETIRSRVQKIDVRKTEDRSILKALVEREGIEEEDARRISRLANGNWLKALEEISPDNENKEFLNSYINIMRTAYKRDVGSMKTWSDNIAAFGREKQKRFLEYSLRMTRESFIYNFGEDELSYMTAKEETFVSKFATFINEANILKLSELMNNAIRDIRQNANARIIFFDLALNLAVQIRQK